MFFMRLPCGSLRCTVRTNFAARRSVFLGGQRLKQGQARSPIGQSHSLPIRESRNVAWRETPRAVGSSEGTQAKPAKRRPETGNGLPPGGASSVVATLQPASEAAILLGSDDGDGDQLLAPYMDTVVKVYCTHTEPNHSMPWQRKRQYASTSSGFVVTAGGRRWLLTNAHSVDYYTQVKVKRRGDDRKFLASVLSVGVDCDIALLDVADEDFWRDVPLLEFGPLPRLQESVAVVGYPIGGDTISVTVGVVSRIEVTEYSHGSTELLGLQIDAAINGGNSGGPVFNGAGQCVGIAFQALVGSDVEGVGYVIPTPVVHHFLADYLATGTFSGFPMLGIKWQRMESEALRRACGMTPQQKGILIRSVNPTSAAAQVLLPNDVLLAFDGVELSCDGTVPFRSAERIAFSYLISNKYVGDTARLLLLRDGQQLELDVTLSLPRSLVPAHLSNRDPPYLVLAGLVFVVASEPYLASEFGSDYSTDAPVKLLDRLYHAFPSAPDEEVVVLSQVLACDATLGYEDLNNVQLLRFNGEKVGSLRHLAQLAAACRAPFLRFELEYCEMVVLEASAAARATAEVLAAHNIPTPVSPGLAAALKVNGAAGGAECAPAPAVTLPGPLLGDEDVGDTGGAMREPAERE